MVRSPLYEMGKLAEAKTHEELAAIMEDSPLRGQAIDPIGQAILGPLPTRDNPEYYRHGRSFLDDEDDDGREILWTPSNNPMMYISKGELYKISKTDDHWKQVSRSKSYIAQDFFPPQPLKTGQLKEAFEDDLTWQSDPESSEYIQWRTNLISVIP